MLRATIPNSLLTCVHNFKQAGSVGGGFGNHVRSNYALVLGGYRNHAQARFAVVLGGSKNTVNGRFGIAMGYNAKITGDYSGVRLVISFCFAFFLSVYFHAFLFG